MDDKEFKKRVKKIAKKHGVEYRETRQGKGSHSRVYYGERFATVKQGELGAGLLNEMCKQLGLTKIELMET
jgi:mRNA interferase HicA